MEKRKIIITGTTGFVGLYVDECLKGRKDVVAWVRKKNPRIDTPYETIDLINKEEVLTCGKQHSNLEMIVHIASVTENNGGQWDLNLKMMESLIALARSKGKCPIVFVSSNSVNYSDRPYALSKKECEDVLVRSGVPYLIIRPTLIVGKGSKDIEKIVSVIKKVPIIPLPGAKESKQSPIWVGDVANLIRLIIDNPEVAASNRIISIGGPEKIGLETLMMVIMERIEMNKKIFPIPSKFISWINPKMTQMLTRDISVTNDKLLMKKLNWKIHNIRPDNVY